MDRYGYNGILFTARRPLFDDFLYNIWCYRRLIRSRNHRVINAKEKDSSYC